MFRLHDHTQTRHIRKDSSGRVITLTQRPLPVNTQHSQETDIHTLGGIRTRNPSKRGAANPCLRSRGHWDRLVNTTNCELFVFVKVYSMFPFTFTNQQIQTFRCSTLNHMVCWRLLIFVPSSSPYCEIAWFILVRRHDVPDISCSTLVLSFEADV
jgi:hypothetical protein